MSSVPDTRHKRVSHAAAAEMLMSPNDQQAARSGHVASSVHLEERIDHD
jgi:hypothetical protein